jgi:hypothetical protein
MLMLTARTAHAKMANGVNKQAALAVDGSRLYVIGTHSSVEDGQYVQTGLGLQVIDLATGEITAHIDSEAQSLTLDMVNGRLYLHGWAANQTITFTSEWTDVLDAATLEQVTRIDKAVAVARRLDGTSILLSTTALGNGQTELAALDPQTFEVISASADVNRDYTGWVVMR